jgi:hypothetical protein
MSMFLLKQKKNQTNKNAEMTVAKINQKEGKQKITNKRAKIKMSALCAH